MKNFTGAQKTVFATVAFFGVISLGYLAMKTNRTRIAESLKVIQVDTKLLDHINNENMLNNLFLLAA